MGISTVPSAPKSTSWVARLPFYYGWVSVVLGAVAMSATLPGRTYGLGLIKEPLCDTFHIGDLRFSVLNFWAIILGAVVVLPVGWLIDRIGLRAVLTGVYVALGCSVLLMSQAWDKPSLFVSLTLVRGFGQGALSVVAIALVGKWFKRRVGPAMGVFALLLSIGFGVTIPALTSAVKHLGWANAWEGMGWCLLLGLAPTGWLLARNSPEACGVTPDGASTEDFPPAPSVPLFTALGTPAFWVYTLAATLFNFLFSALTLDSESLLTEHGLKGSEVNGVLLTVLMVSGLPANIVAGWLARRRPMGKILSVGVAALAVSLVIFPAVINVPMAMAYGALLGVSGGIITVIYFAVYGHTYGRGQLGSIQATVQVLSVFASASGPVALAGSRTFMHGSDGFFFVSAALASVLAAVTWFLKPPVLVQKGTS